MTLSLLIIIILLFASASFSCSETALFSLSRSEVAGFKSSPGILARQIIDVLSNPRRLLVSILLGNELVNVAIAVLVASFIYQFFLDFAWQVRILIAIAISTPLIIVVGEVIPKNIGVRFAKNLAPACAVFIKGFAYITLPLLKPLLWLSDRVILLFGGDPKKVRSMIMEEEFRNMVDLGCEEGSLGEEEGELIHRVFELSDKSVEEIATPREAIFSLALNSDINSALVQIRTTQFSRIPVYESSPDDIVGILYTRDLFSFLRRDKAKIIRDMEEIIRPACFISHLSKIEDVLKEFQKLKIHMGIVINEGHNVLGVVTMDDVFGALFKDE